MKKNIKVRSPKKRSEQSGGAKTAIILLKSFAIGLACMMILLGIASQVSVTTDISAAAVPAVALIISALSAFIGGLYAARKLGRKGLISGAVSQIGLFLFTASITTLINKEISVWLLLPFALMIVSGALGGLTAVNVRRKK